MQEPDARLQARAPSGATRRGAPSGQRRTARSSTALFEGPIKLEIGPLGDFSQLVGFEDAVGQLGASEISVERFSEGRATLSMHLDQPVELLRELEELSPLDFKVRHTAAGQPDPRRRRGPGPRAARRLAAPAARDKLAGRSGAVAQLEERRAGSAKVRGSSPLSSTQRSDSLKSALPLPMRER